LTTQITARIQKVIDFNKQHSVLSAWENGFLESVFSQAQRKGQLSIKQIEIFEKAEIKCTSEALEEAKAWTKLYRIQHQETAKICARYYKITGYFSDLSANILGDSEFVPSERQYKKMCENKYAQKVLAMANAKPLYTIGTTIVIRRPALKYNNRHLELVPCLVLEVLDEIKSAAKGAKQYRVLPYGEAAPLVLEERQIKKCKPGAKKKSKKKSFDDIPF